MKRMAISLCLVALMFFGGMVMAEAQCTVADEGLPDKATPILGAKYSSFGAPASGDEVGLGPHPPAVIPPALVDWASTNTITLSWDSTASPATLTSVITPEGSTPTVVVYAFQTPPSGTFDFMYLNLNLQGQGSADFSATVNGCDIGEMGSTSQVFEKLLTEVDFTQNFTLTGTLTLDGNLNGNSYLEILVGSRAPENKPPDCTNAAASFPRLWPPNHRFKDVQVLGVTDPDGDPVTIIINSIFQDEPVDGEGDGNTAPDASGVGSSTAQVRAERSGQGDGRFYHIGFTASDPGGLSCTGEVLVAVPKSKGKKWWDNPMDGGALYDSTVP